MSNDEIDDGSSKPLGYQTDDGCLEVRDNGDGTRGYHETELGQHQRWLTQAPDLFEQYQALLAQVRALTAERDRLRRALADIVEDVEERWDMGDPLTPPGIRHCVRQARQALARPEGLP